jgi:hypothetical protein
MSHTKKDTAGIANLLTKYEYAAVTTENINEIVEELEKTFGITVKIEPEKEKGKYLLRTN